MTWKDIIKQDIKAKILAEIKKEGGALGMKNLKQFGEEAEIKLALSELEKDGKIFMHKDGDIYTHKPKFPSSYKARTNYFPRSIHGYDKKI